MLTPCRLLASVAASTLALALVPPRALAQVRTRVVEVPYYRDGATASARPPSIAPGAASLVSLACARGVRIATRCRRVAARAADPSGQLLEPIATCYGAGGVAPRAADHVVARAVQRGLEAASSAAPRTTVVLPDGAGPVLLVVRWTDLVRPYRCVRWARRCRGTDCDMGTPPPYCVQEEQYGARERTTEWGWVDPTGAVTLRDAPHFFRSGVGLVRVESARVDADDTSIERSTLGTLDRAALRMLATSTRDPIAGYAAWANLAIAAWTAADEDGLREATEQVGRTRDAALAAAPAAARSALAAPAEALARALASREGNPVRPPCSPSTGE